MRIAILAWGSLIWDPRTLKIDKTQNENGWVHDGPMLPIEFARISSDGRLTLVIKNGSIDIKTFYAISKCDDIDHAILDLAIREGSGKNKIGYYSKHNKKISPDNFKNEESITQWINNHNNIDGVIWTNLSPNFKDKIDHELNPDNVINYLKYLPPDVQAKAEEYIRKTPAVVETPLRKAIAKALQWHPIIN